MLFRDLKLLTASDVPTYVYAYFCLVVEDWTKEMFAFKLYI